MDIRRKLIYPAVCGAVYAALTLLLAPISYGALQFRLSEALCILPYLLPECAWGLFLGCALANTASAAGVLDIVFGSLATLGAALCTAALGRRERLGGPVSRPRRLAAAAMPVLWNGVVVGCVLSAALMPREAFFTGALLLGAQVALGEAVVMGLLGLPLLRILPRLPILSHRM